MTLARACSKQYLMALSLATTLLGAGCATESGAPAPSPAPKPFELSWLSGHSVHEPRLVLRDDDALLLIWREKAAEGSDLFLARQSDDGHFQPAVRINDVSNTAGSFPHDELRPAVAVGDGGLLAVAWGDSRGHVRTAISHDGGESFAVSQRLEQVEEAAYRGFPAIAFDPGGTLHAVWIDSRFAEGMAEEPADLFYARVTTEGVVERNLTADQAATVCGCCRPYLDVTADGSLRALFRNADDDGYRDIFAVSGPPAKLPPPRRIGEPRWKLQGCPMSGPTAVGDRVVWPDGSSGRKLLLQAPMDGPSTPLFTDEARGDWRSRLSPRPVPAAGGQRNLLLLPGQVTSRLVALTDTGVEILADDLPAWASDAVYDGVALRLVGAIDGEVQFATAWVDL